MTLLRPDLMSDYPTQVAVPSYDREQVTVGIVHFGIGGFHRTHQAVYLDRLMNAGGALDWGICGVGVMPPDREMADDLTKQDGLYTVVIKHPDGRLEPRIVGSIVEALYAPDDPERVLAALIAPETRIVSLTITEGGYNYNQVTGEFDVDAPAIVAERQPGAAPTTVFGYIVTALKQRRARGIAPFTVMSCDNIQANGDTARRMFGAYAALIDPELATWIAANVRFPNSMVDRITPATTEGDRAELRTRFDIEDRRPVVCEPFSQWVLEDNFTLGRPALERAGVQVVTDVEPYELMKLRLLNASHQALAYLGYLAGHRYVHEVLAEPRFVAHVRAYMDREASPTLLPVPGIDLDAYKSELIERFSNPAIRDTVSRLCAESSDRIPKWVLPVLRHNLSTGGEITRTVATVASWARYAEGVDEAGEPIEISDRLAGTTTALARQYPEQPLALLSLTELFGDLGLDERFTNRYAAILDRLHAVGSYRTLVEINDGQFPD
jgi:mannitol 2-dehydrogenase